MSDRPLDSTRIPSGPAPEASWPRRRPPPARRRPAGDRAARRRPPAPGRRAPTAAARRNRGCEQEATGRPDSTATRPKWSPAGPAPRPRPARARRGRVVHDLRQGAVEVGEARRWCPGRRGSPRRAGRRTRRGRAVSSRRWTGAARRVGADDHDDLGARGATRQRCGAARRLRRDRHAERLGDGVGITLRTRRVVDGALLRGRGVGDGDVAVADRGELALAVTGGVGQRPAGAVEDGDLHRGGRVGGGRRRRGGLDRDGGGAGLHRGAGVAVRRGAVDEAAVPAAAPGAPARARPPPR